MTKQLLLTNLALDKKALGGELANSNDDFEKKSLSGRLITICLVLSSSQRVATVAGNYVMYSKLKLVQLLVCRPQAQLWAQTMAALLIGALPDHSAEAVLCHVWDFSKNV